jgi:hypothetical protein
MSTGKAFANFTLKRLLSASDLKTRMMDYLREYVQDHFAVSYDSPATISTSSAPWELTSSAQDTFTVEALAYRAGAATSAATDGYGHLLRLPLPADPEVLAVGQQKTYPFPNEGGVLYHVGMRRCEISSGIVMNPRTGAPEYLETIEAIGYKASPLGVVDNLDGTMTMSVASRNPGVPMQDRWALVYKSNTPDPNAISEGIAFALVQVQWLAGDNIVVVDYLGQSSPSTTPSVYTVVILGVEVDTVTFVGEDGVIPLGTVLGNGPLATPIDFSMSDQPYIDSSLVRATEYNGGPNWYDGTPNPPTTVEGQLDNIITQLSGAFAAYKVRGPAIDGPTAGWADGQGYSIHSVGAMLADIVFKLGRKELFAGGTDVIGVKQILAPSNGFAIPGISAGGTLSAAISTIYTAIIQAARVSFQSSMTSWRKSHVYLGNAVGTPALVLKGYYDAKRFATLGLTFIAGTFNGRAVCAASAHKGNWIPFNVGGAAVTDAHSIGRGEFVSQQVGVSVTESGVGAYYEVLGPVLGGYVAPAPGLVLTFTLKHTLTGSTMCWYFYLGSTGGIDGILVGDNGRWSTRTSTTWTSQAQINAGNFTGRKVVFSSLIGRCMIAGNNGANQCLLYSFLPGTPASLTTVTPPTTDEMVDMATTSTGFLLLTRSASGGTLWLSTNGTSWANVLTLFYRPTGMSIARDNQDTAAMVVGQYTPNQGSFITYSTDSFKVSGNGSVTTHIFCDEDTSAIRYDGGDASLYKPKDFGCVTRDESECAFVVLDQVIVRPGSDNHFGRIWTTPRFL